MCGGGNRPRFQYSLKSLKYNFLLTFLNYTKWINCIVLSNALIFVLRLKNTMSGNLIHVTIVNTKYTVLQKYTTKAMFEKMKC